jgi:predicted transcriptional regulator
MAISKTRTEGFRAQALEYIRKNPGVTSTDLRDKAEQFGTDGSRLSKTLWAMAACGLVVQKKVDETKKVGPVHYFVPEHAPADMKAEVRLARELQRTGTTMTERRKESAEAPQVATPPKVKGTKEEQTTPEKPARTRKSDAVVEAPAEVKTQKRGRKSLLTESEPASESASESAPTGKRTKTTKTHTSESLQAPLATSAVTPTAAPIVKPVSLEQQSLFEEASAQKPPHPGRPAAVQKPQEVGTADTPVQTGASQAPASSPLPATPAIDVSALAAGLHAYADPLSDLLSNMVLVQMFQKVQQGLNGLAHALFQAAAQTPSMPLEPAPAPPTLAMPDFKALLPMMLGSLGGMTGSQAIPPASAPISAQPASAASSGQLAETSQQALLSREAAPTVDQVKTEVGSDSTQDTSETPVARRPVLHTPVRREETPRQPKVFVIGLIPHQAGIIQSEFHECFDLRFAEADTPAKRLESMANDCDRVIVLTSFISHSTQDAVKKHPGFERISGGMARLKDRLMELFLASEAAQNA